MSSRLLPRIRYFPIWDEIEVVVIDLSLILKNCLKNLNFELGNIELMKFLVKICSISVKIRHSLSIERFRTKFNGHLMKYYEIKTGSHIKLFVILFFTLGFVLFLILTSLPFFIVMVSRRRVEHVCLSKQRLNFSFYVTVGTGLQLWSFSFLSFYIFDYG